MPSFSSIALTSGSNYEASLDALLIYIDTKITFNANYEFQYFFDDEGFAQTIIEQVGVEDQRSVKVLNSSLNEDDFWVISYRISSYERDIALTEENRQKVLFGNDDASLVAPIKEVKIDFNGEIIYFAI